MSELSELFMADCSFREQMLSLRGFIFVHPREKIRAFVCISAGTALGEIKGLLPKLTKPPLKNIHRLHVADNCSAFCVWLLDPVKENRGQTLTSGRYGDVEQSCLMNISALGVYICQSHAPLFVVGLCEATRHKSRQLAALIKTL